MTLGHYKWCKFDHVTIKFDPTKPAQSNERLGLESAEKLTAKTMQ